MKITVLAVAVVLFAGGGRADAWASAPGLTVKAEGPAVIKSSISFTVHSEAVGRDFVVRVTSPYTTPVLPGQTAPVLYVLDGGYDLAGPAGLLMGGSGLMAPAYIVTIGYPEGASAREIDLLFGRGVRPNGTVAQGGGAAAFLDFLTLELKPFIEARYPVKGAASALFGHSLSGVFTANVLARQPRAFDGYIIASPSLWADPNLVDRLKALKADGPPRRVFVGYGADEDAYMVDGAHAVSDALASSSATILKTHAFEGQQHISYYPALTTEAFPFVLPRGKAMRRPDPVSLPAVRLQRYLGQYALADGRKITVSQDEDGLVFQVEGREETGLLAEANDRFYIHGVDASIVFDPGDGPPGGMSISINGATARAERVSPALPASPAPRLR